MKIHSAYILLSLFILLGNISCACNDELNDASDIEGVWTQWGDSYDDDWVGFYLSWTFRDGEVRAKDFDLDEAVTIRYTAKYSVDSDNHHLMFWYQIDDEENQPTLIKVAEFAVSFLKNDFIRLSMVSGVEHDERIEDWAKNGYNNPFIFAYNDYIYMKKFINK